MVYLFLGPDELAKEKKVNQIKATLFTDHKALLFDLEILDAQSMPAQALKKALDTLPAMSAKRLIIIRNAHKLKIEDLQVLTRLIKEGIKHADIVINAQEASAKAEWKALMALCQVSNFFLAVPKNAFDMTKLISCAQAGSALKMLHEFYADNVHPLQIMGALVWYWSRDGKALGQAKFEQGLKVLQQADLNMKRSRFDAHYALEKAIVELAVIKG